MFKKKQTTHDILGKIEKKVRKRYFQDVDVLRLPESVLNCENYKQVMIEKLYKYKYYDPVNQRLYNYKLKMREELDNEDFKKQRDRLLAEYNQLLQDVDQQIEQRIHEAIQQSNRKPPKLKIVQIITGPRQNPVTQKQLDDEYRNYLMGSHTLQEWLKIFNQLWQTKPKPKKAMKRTDEEFNTLEEFRIRSSRKSKRMKRKTQMFSMSKLLAI